MSLLRNDVPKVIRDKNREATLSFFGGLTQLNKPAIQETLIMAYGQAARYVHRPISNDLH
jgi:serine/threonine-protein kinase ATR